jgi:hypothetical protein
MTPKVKLKVKLFDEAEYGSGPLPSTKPNARERVGTERTARGADSLDTIVTDSSKVRPSRPYQQ